MKQLTVTNERVEQTVELILAEHGGGTPFFDALDASLRRPPFMDLLLDQFADRFGPDFDIVVSGKFGVAFCRYLAGAGRERLQRQLGGKMPLLVPGGLRHATTLPLQHARERIEGRLFVFLDDSLYKARTRDLIRREMREVGGQLIHELVLYDGSALRYDDVTSFYRYFDRHPQNSPLLQTQTVLAQQVQMSRD
jgi:hypothetical protein